MGKGCREIKETLPQRYAKGYLHMAVEGKAAVGPKEEIKEILTSRCT
jgi:hypothetical protein